MDAYYLFENLITIVAVLAVLYALYFPFIRRRRRAPKISNTPILLAYYTHNAQILPATKGIIGDLKYNALAVLPREATTESSIILHVQLPYMTAVHLLGIPKKSGGAQIDPTAWGSVMEEVILEGDYPNYFNLYADKELQHEARYVLDPSAMLFTVDFCQAHKWEIIKGDLYFVQDSEMKNDEDPTHMWDDMENFVNKIRPAIETKNTTAYDVPKPLLKHLKCPICLTELERNGDYYPCTNMHGLLVNGTTLMLALDNKEVKINKNPIIKPNTTRELKCPACGKEMRKELLRSANTQVDRCIKCPYNWLDRGELLG